MTLLPAALTRNYNAVRRDDWNDGAHVHLDEIRRLECTLDQAPPERLLDSVCDHPLWRLTHALGYCIGGVFFTIGTALYYPAIADAAQGDESGVAKLGVWTAWLYTIGSAGFLYVDVQEFFTFSDDFTLRVNISCSMIGSAFYLIGSAGFLPQIYEATTLVGILGFLMGSAFIGCSQAWKLSRILSTREDE